MSSRARYSQQSGKSLWIVLLLILLLAVAVGYYFYTHSTTPGYDYRSDQETELHGVVHWEHSNIPATRTEVALFQQQDGSEKLLSRKPVEKGYYRFTNIPAGQPLFIRVYRITDQSEDLIMETSSRRLREGRAKYFPLYLPSRRERQSGGFPDRLEGRVITANGTVYLGQNDSFRIKLSGARLDELAALQDYLVVAKGQYQSRELFRVGDYYVLEGDTGDRPLLGRLEQQHINGVSRYVLVGEEDRQLLLVPDNYRLLPRIKRNLGALVMLSGPVEQDAIKPLTLTVVKH